MKEEVDSVMIGLLDCGGLWSVECLGLTVSFKECFSNNRHHCGRLNAPSVYQLNNKRPDTRGVRP